MGVIVVGVDHSEGAKAALRFALEEARFRQASLRAVHAMARSVSYGLRWLVDVSADPSRGRGSWSSNVDQRCRADGDDVEIERRVVEGAPGAVLVDESRDADLLVVGSRGHGGFAGLLLGSVSQQCAHHAECPVVIVRAPSGLAG